MTATTVPRELDSSPYARYVQSTTEDPDNQLHPTRPEREKSFESVTREENCATAGGYHVLPKWDTRPH